MHITTHITRRLAPSMQLTRVLHVKKIPTSNMVSLSPRFTILHRFTSTTYPTHTIISHDTPFIGKITEWHKEEGQQVRQDDVIATIEGAGEVSFDIVSSKHGYLAKQLLPVDAVVDPYKSIGILVDHQEAVDPFETYPVHDATSTVFLTDSERRRLASTTKWIYYAKYFFQSGAALAAITGVSLGAHQYIPADILALIEQPAMYLAIFTYFINFSGSYKVTQDKDYIELKRLPRNIVSLAIHGASLGIAYHATPLFLSPNQFWLSFFVVMMLREYFLKPIGIAASHALKQPPTNIRVVVPSSN